jgi:hypothetical protein
MLRVCTVMTNTGLTVAASFTEGAFALRRLPDLPMKHIGLIVLVQ